ncbi:TPA: hypothetical protein SL603_005775 [Pseudomonas aeruginosa]|nr:hypothetical protein [Pseudomonas aeruginosa]
MSKVKRLNFTVPQFESVVPYASEHGQYVRYADYAKLEAEAQALREEVVRLLEDRARFPDKPDDIGRMIGAHIENLKHVAEASRRMCLKAMRERDVVEQDLETLRARVVVLPEPLNEGDARRECGEYGAAMQRGYNACLRELARINGMTVSEGLLRRVCAEQPATCCMDDEMSWRRDRDSALIELRALLNEDKENSNG